MPILPFSERVFFLAYFISHLLLIFDTLFMCVGGGFGFHLTNWKPFKLQTKVNIPLTRLCAIHVLWRKHQARSIHVCKNKINRLINSKKYKILRGPTHFKTHTHTHTHTHTYIYIYIYIYNLHSVWQMQNAWNSGS